MRHFLSELLAPTRTARAIPLGRLAIASLFVFATLFVVFSLTSVGVRLPFLSHPYVVKAWFTDAAGLDPGNGPQVSVAGVPEGQVTDVSYQNGRALVTMSLGDGARGRVFRDAGVRVRPFNGANFLEVDILPGHPAAGALPAGSTIASSSTSVPVTTDQVFDVLDADTRAYLQVLTEQAAIAMRGNGGRLGAALRLLAPLTTDARALGSMLARRNHLISEYIGASNRVFGTLARRRALLATTVATISRLLSVTAGRTRELQLATRELPALLGQVQSTGGALTSFGPEIDQALASLVPTSAAFAAGARSAESALPSLNRLLDAVSGLTAGTGPAAADLVRISGRLRQGLGQAVQGYRDLAQLIRIILAHEKPLTHFANVMSGLFSTQDRYSTVVRAKITGIQPLNLADLGVAPSATDRASASSSARPGPAGASTVQTPAQLRQMVAAGLRALCRRSRPLACVLAVGTPGLPGSSPAQPFQTLSRPPGSGR